MFKPAPIDKNFVPYTKRPRGKYSAGRFVDGGGGKGRSGAHVVPQGEDDCPKHKFHCGQRCLTRNGYCNSSGDCVPPERLSCPPY
jgi:hypothetical protein